ncbi:ATP-binding protein [Aliiroseovarius subalbicans]|uniref:ATP-binding protein n=1 Tax=Aliiroseovarius subalbicans TaxID=2925840 RepID=UPI001F599BFE|nr:ATP-binding protein [Aliiroseovarius subalbicans]MCI2400813.1 ATP-binding protein [Aliiroseovarius subalbicans]
MIEKRPFSTRARTVDHLGREQIADVPTAVSELWKNSYDAYATKANMLIERRDQISVSLTDNGHGMTKQDIFEKWLVVGTDTKLANDESRSRPLFGLEYRPKQGQKGIGRLSSAHLGPLMLLISKSHECGTFVALLIDWRVFENPFLILSDITTPVVEASSIDAVFEELPDLVSAVRENIAPEVPKNATDFESARAARIREAWRLFDEGAAAGDYGEAPPEPPSELVLNTLRTAELSKRQLGSWSVLSGEDDHGTALIISNASDELAGLFEEKQDDRHNRFIQTLAGFVDPFADSEQTTELNSGKLQFDYRVEVLEGEQKKIILGSQFEFSRQKTDELEHIIEGSFDANGVFHGRIKAFGQWIQNGETVSIPPGDMKIPKTPKSKLGAFDVYFATYEQRKTNSTLEDGIYSLFDDEKFGPFAGPRVYRNGLRVMPYGRPDNDFFEIEQRRNRHAGREFWNSQRMYGRIAISQANNPNLRDKAGREGFILNTATRTLKKLVVDLLMYAAREYFGTDSEVRKNELPEIQQRNKEERAKKERRKLVAKQRRSFRSNLRKMNKDLPDRVQSARSRFDNLDVSVAEDIPVAQQALEDCRNLLAAAKVPGRPNELGSLEEEYAQFRQKVSELRSLVEEFSLQVEEWIDKINPPDPADIAEKQLQRLQGSLHARTTKWSKHIKELQGEEITRVQELVSTRNRVLNQLARPYIDQLVEEEIGLNDVSKALTALWETVDTENQDIFENYIFALESLKESIDLQTIAVVGEQENANLRSEVDRLNSLAQLGIAVEILGHELQSYDDMIGRGLDALPPEFRSAPDAGQLIRTGYHGLTQQLQFLSPLQLSGERTQRKISGSEIFEYLQKFFSRQISDHKIDFMASDAFKRFSLFGQPSRIFPVFINLVNNSQYWVSKVQSEQRKILLDAKDERIVVSDNGPGVDEIDEKRLFSLFFTRKAFGGRGIGLYLCKANLAAAGHEISYATENEMKLLPGANFVLSFKTATFE